MPSIMQSAKSYLNIVMILSISHVAYANDAGKILDNVAKPQDHHLQNIENIEKKVIQQHQNQQKLPKKLPTETSIDDETVAKELDNITQSKKQAKKSLTKEETIVFFRQNPQEFEKFLLILLQQGNAAALKELLPIYQQYPQHDPSVIDWGNAIIKATSGDLKQAIQDYRRFQARLPNVKKAQFQLAMALYFNRQYQAAKIEFEQLRKKISDPDDIKAINSYLNAIKKQQQWDISFNASYLSDKNITNAPKVGSTLTNANGSTTYTSPHHKGEGFNYSASLSKKWLFDNRFFTTLNLDVYGKHYWDNKKFNDVTVSIGENLGYQNHTTQIEAGPYLNRRWYAGGTSGNGKLEPYSDTYGIKLNLSQWLSPKLRYQGYMSISESKYDSKYHSNNSTDKQIANSILYFANQKNYYTIGHNYSSKKALSKGESYDRKGFRLGWGHLWGKNFSTMLNLSYAKRDYQGVDFFGIQRANQEYGISAMLWRRDLQVLGLTPRLLLEYNKVTSNSPFEVYDKSNINLEFSKNF